MRVVMVEPKSEEELSEFAEDIINTVREPLIILDQDLRVVKASRSFYEFFKVNQEDTIGTLIYDLGNKQWNIPKLKELLETILPEKTTFDNYEVEHDFSTIGKRIMLLNSRQIKRALGKEKIILLAIEDITDRRIKEKSFHETSRIAREYLDNLVNYGNTPIVLWDTDLIITAFNPAFESLTGYTAEEVIDKNIEILFPPEEKEATLQSLKELNIGKKGKTIEFNVRSKEGALITLLWNSSNIFLDDGITIVGNMAQGIDITTRIRAEEEMRKAMKNLEASNKELEQFAHIASHDLQEPLRMVASYTQLLERRYKDKLDQDANDFINFAVDGATRMQRLINDLLDYSRVTTKAKDPQLVDSNNILGQAHINLRRVIEDTSAIITKDELPQIWADEGQLVRVFQNLIANAIKFTKNVVPNIHISVKEQSDSWLFSVMDNGIGIDKQFEEKIFTIFQRLHTRDEFPGTGIGLAICKRIIERHGGKIWFEPAPEQGTIFYFTIAKRSKD